MSVFSIIEEKIRAAFKPMYFELINESDRHVGHTGHDGSGESHFKLIVVSSVFEGVSRVERQRLVHKEVSEAFSAGLHALSLKLYSPSENL